MRDLRIAGAIPLDLRMPEIDITRRAFAARAFVSMPKTSIDKNRET
jgi:hypothetical protein